MNTKITLFMAFALLSFYCLCGGLMEHFVVFDSWNFVAGKAYGVIHSRSGWRVMLIYVSPLIALFALDLLLLWQQPAFLPKSWIWAAIVCHIVTWLSSAFIQVPLQMALYEVQNLELMHKLILSDWIRLSALLIHTGLALASIRKFAQNLTLSIPFAATW